MTPLTQLRSMRPTSMLRASHCQLSAWLFFIICISTTSSELGWRSVWPCATWSIERLVGTKRVCKRRPPLTLLCFVGLDLMPLFCKGSLSQQQSIYQNHYRTNCQPVVQWRQQIWRGDYLKRCFSMLSRDALVQWRYLFILFLQLTLYLHFLWIGPLQAATVIVLLLYVIGPSCLAGMSVFFILLPVQTLFGRLFSTFRFVLNLRI